MFHKVLLREILFKPVLTLVCLDATQHHLHKEEVRLSQQQLHLEYKPLVLVQWDQLSKMPKDTLKQMTLVQHLMVVIVE